MSLRALVIPDIRRGHGTGHLKRAAKFVRDFNGLSDAYAALAVDYPWDTPVREPAVVKEIVAGPGVQCLSWPGRESDRECDRKEEWDCIVVDAQDMSREHVCELSVIAPVVGIDLGGDGRQHADYLIDTMLNLETHRPNRFEPGLNRLPPRTRSEVPASGGAMPDGIASNVTVPDSITSNVPTSGVQPARVLIAPGGEDPAGLTEKLLAALTRSGNNHQVDVAEGPFRTAANAQADLEQCVNGVIRTDDLASHLSAYDVVITTFGLTSYEALAAGCTVIHVAPTEYHAKLSRKAGIPLAGSVGYVDRNALFALLASHKGMNREQDPLRPKQSGTLAEAVHGLVHTAFEYERIDPGSVCDIRPPAAARFTDRTYREGRFLRYLQRFTESSIRYNERYFFDEYEAQYGRSYLEDFEHITNMCRDRMRHIERIRPSDKKRIGNASNQAHPPASDHRRVLVDLGCAYGPMLSAASEYGYEPFGVDYFEGAIGYVREKLGFHAVQGDICDPALPESLGLKRKADVVTLWYVIEHVRDLKALFTVIHRLLKPGGVFAFSTPNGSGGSARRNLTEFLRHSPEDHWSVWDAQRTPEFLKANGFSSCRVRVTGHHPERFAPRASATRVGRHFMEGYSRLRGLGDTFEAYAVKDNGA